MKSLLLTGTTPIAFVILLFIAAAAFSIYIYKSHKLKRPWNIILPTIRVLVIALLAATLLQPVIAFISKSVTRGVIPILIDNSGSMSIADKSNRPSLIKICSRLKMLPKGLRISTFENMSKNFKALDKHIRNISLNTDKVILTYEIDKLKQELERFTKRFNADLATTDTLIKKKKYLLHAERVKRQQGLNFEMFLNIPGNKLSALYNSKKYPNGPDKKMIIRNFKTPVSLGDNFGCRIWGYFTPPTTGNYQFFIVSDDQGELLISSDADPANKYKICNVENFTSRLDYSSYPSQQSERIWMQKGRKYYIEANYKENTGDDFLSIAWKKPDGVFETIVPGNVLSPTPPQPLLAEFYALYQHLKEEGKKFSKAITDSKNYPEEDEMDEQEKINKFKTFLADKQKKIYALRNRCNDLQILVDKAIANSKNPLVNKAIEKVSSMSRLDMVNYVLHKKPFEMLKKLDDKADVDIYLLDSPVEPVSVENSIKAKAIHNSTRIGSVLNKILNNYSKQPISSVLLFSDGNNNSGKSFPEIKEVLNERNIKLFSFTFDNNQPPADISIESVIAPQTSFKDDILDMSVIINNNGFLNKPLKLTVKSGDKVLVEKEIKSGNNPVVRKEISFMEPTSGLRHYQIEIQKCKGEVLYSNNSKSVSVNILTDPVKVLMIDEYPRWESRYLNMMLNRDKRINVNTIFIGSSEDGNLKFGDDNGMFPDSKEKLFSYDVLIIGDVNPRHFLIDIMNMIHDFVIEKGGSLLVMAGQHYMPNSYRETPISEVLPLNIQPRSITNINKNHENMEVNLEVSKMLSGENIIQIGKSPSSTENLWKGLPSLNWVKEGVSPSEQANVLIQRKETKAPVVLTAFSGLGKIVYIGSDSFWKWRYRIRWKYHHRFWSQIILWAIQGRTSGKDKYVKLQTDRQDYSPEETITFKARIFDKNEKPLENGTVSAEIYNDNDKDKLIKSIKFTSLKNSGGEYRAQVKGLTRGKYRVVPYVDELKNLDIAADYTFEVKDIPTSEYIKLMPDIKALNSISDENFNIMDALDSLEEIPKKQIIEEIRRDVEIWNSFYFLIAVGLLLALEWQIRKSLKLV